MDSRPTRITFKLFFQVLSVYLGGFASFNAVAVDTELFVHTSSISYSEIAPIKQFADSLYGPMIDSGNVAFSSSLFALGQKFRFDPQFGEVHYAIFSRLDYSLKFSPETAMVLYADENGIALDNSQSRDIYLRANHLRASGASVAYEQYPLQNFGYRFQLSYLQASKMIYGDIRGELTSLGRDAQGALDLNYYYSEDVFFDREKNDNRGSGFSSDLYLEWQPTAALNFEFWARDLASKIVWRRQQQTLASATTDRVKVDERGDTQVRAALIWEEVDGRVAQRLPKQFTLKAHYTITNRDSLLLEQFIYDGEAFNRFGYRRYFWDASFGEISYDMTAEAYSVELNMDYLKFGLRTDKFNFDQAKLFGFYLAISAPLKLF